MSKHGTLHLKQRL